MLGTQIGQGIGQITTTRVLPAGPDGPELEVSFEGSGRLLDADITDMGTYVSVAHADGTVSGQGQGITMSAEGDVLTWTGSGVGRMLGRGQAASYRGAIYYRSSSARFARLNGLACVFEYDVDEGGKTETKLFEWQ
ncbi:MAG TPA: hypothetical protein VFV76_05800 [Actinomycetes bacterium]|nr:hypothetical protein [Actinomycetes bacterium]